MSKLKDYRENNTILTQKDLANLAGVSLRTLQDYEQGRKNLNTASVETVMKLSMALNTDISNIIDYDNVRNAFINHISHILTEIETDPGAHSDYLEDYDCELDFYLSNATENSYIGYISDNYPVTKEEAQQLQDIVIEEITKKYD